MESTQAMQVTQVVRTATPTVLHREVSAECAWQREDFRAERVNVPLTDAALAELRALANDPMIYQGEIEDFAPDLAGLRETSRILAKVRRQLDQGIGLAILDRLPVEDWDERQSTSVVFQLTSMLGQVVRQKWQGARLYHVRDTGKPLGYGVRRSITNLRQEFHTDGGWLELTPEAIGLACLRQAERGGESRVVSLARVHNVLRQRHPELLARLYQNFWWDRQAEHAPGEDKCNFLPVFSRDGEQVSCRYYDDYVRKGHDMMGEPLGVLAEEALEAMQEVVESPDSWIEFRLEQGQVEFVNNRLLAHGRKAFQDPSESDAQRHLLRLWVRRSGGIALEPARNRHLS